MERGLKMIESKKVICIDSLGAPNARFSPTSNDLAESVRPMVDHDHF